VRRRRRRRGTASAGAQGPGLDEKLTQVYLHEKSIFRRLNKDLNQLARRDALAQIQSAAKDLGIKEDAQERAELQIRKTFEALGFGKVSIRFRQ